MKKPPEENQKIFNRRERRERREKWFKKQNPKQSNRLVFWKNGVTASVGARGPERNAPEASVGLSLGHGDQSLFPPEEAGGSFPDPSTKKSAPYGSKRAGLAHGPWNHLAFMALLFSKN